MGNILEDKKHWKTALALHEWGSVCIFSDLFSKIAKKYKVDPNLMNEWWEFFYFDPDFNGEAASIVSHEAAILAASLLASEVGYEAR